MNLFYLPHTIYLITNAVNGKVYVGKTEKSVEQRFYEHKGNARRGGEFRLSQAIRKHGHENFSISEIEKVTGEIAADRERFWIAHHRSKQYAHGYNMTDGGEGASGRLLSEDSHLRMIHSQKVRFSQMSHENKAALTKSANDAKRGKKEKPSNKREAQQQRWNGTSAADRKKHGETSKAGVSPEGKVRQVTAMNSVVSPVRTKGYKQPLLTCPICGKSGGAAAIKRYHFDRCKF